MILIFSCICNKYNKIIYILVKYFYYHFYLKYIIFFQKNLNIYIIIITYKLISDMDSFEYDNKYDIYFMVDEDEDTLLHIAIINNQTDNALMIIDNVLLSGREDNFSHTNKLFQTPLHLAVLTDNTMVAHRLVILERGLNAQDKNGNTPLHLACMRNNLMMVDVILSKYYLIDKFIVNYEGFGYIHLAAYSGGDDIIKLLAKRNFSVDFREKKNGKSALHIAVERFSEKTLQVLFDCNCDVNQLTYNNITPLDLFYNERDKKVKKSEYKIKIDKKLEVDNSIYTYKDNIRQMIVINGGIRFDCGMLVTNNYEDNKKCNKCKKCKKRNKPKKSKKKKI